MRDFPIYRQRFFLDDPAPGTAAELYLPLKQGEFSGGAAADLFPAGVNPAALVPFAAGVEDVVEIQQPVDQDAGDHADGRDAEQDGDAADADLFIAGQATTAPGVDDPVAMALQAGHQAASLAFFFTLATARSRFSRDRWSINRMPSRWSISCWMQTA